MSGHPQYPQPIADEQNRPMLDGWKAGKLLLQHCRSCATTYFYPRAMCPHCWSDDIEWREASGDGSVVSFSLIYRPNQASFNAEAPIALAEIRLAEGAAMLARIVGAPPEAIRTNAAVRLSRDPNEVARYPLPVFHLR